MGLLKGGRWLDQWYDTKASRGEFKRQESGFRNWITPDGRAGSSGDSGFPAEKGRYHLYVSLACPWAHRTLIFRELKGLQEYISVSIVDPLMAENGWEFSESDGLYGFKYLYEIYLKSNLRYEGRVTVPVLWDKKAQCIVNNESAEIIRMFNTAFNHLTGNEVDFYPSEFASEIDKINSKVYHGINNGVYRAGFATTQKAYEQAYHALFSELDCLEEKLSGQRYLLGDQITEVDWRLFTTLIRFDAVYYGHFKCNRQLLASFPALFGYVCDLYQQPGIKETVNFAHIKGHYYQSHGMINPTGIVPLGPEQGFNFCHDRDALTKSAHNVE